MTAKGAVVRPLLLALGGIAIVALLGIVFTVVPLQQRSPSARTTPPHIAALAAVIANATPTPCTVAPPALLTDPLSWAAKRIRCDTQHPQEHGLENTRRRALVLYSFTNAVNFHDRQVEVDNYALFRRYGMLRPGYRTALFSGVDYAIVKVNMSRPVAGGVRECARAANVRVFETPIGPCDLCAVSRVFDLLGGAAAIAERYEYIISLNSGVRGPFFSEAKPPLSGGAPVTWVDHMALGGESTYTGRVVTGTGVSAFIRPHLQTYTFSFPATLLPRVANIFAAACDMSGIPANWQAFARAFDTDIHGDFSSFSYNAAMGRKVVHDAALARQAQRLQEKWSIAALSKDDAEDLHRGAQLRARRLSKWQGAMHDKALVDKYPITDQDMAKGRNDNGKMKCIIRGELQMLKAMLDVDTGPLGSAKPAPRPSAAEQSFAEWDPPPQKREPEGPPLPLHFPVVQLHRLSPLLQRASVAGTFAVRSLMHNSSAVTIEHAATAFRDMIGGTGPARKGHREPAAWDIDICLAVFPKYGGSAWRTRKQTARVVAEAQSLTLSQRPPHGAADVHGAGDLPDLDGCPGVRP